MRATCAFIMGEGTALLPWRRCGAPVGWQVVKDAEGHSVERQYSDFCMAHARQVSFAGRQFQPGQWAPAIKERE